MARLRQKVEEHDRAIVPNPCNMVYNCGISSDTTRQLLSRFKTDTDNRLLEGSDGDPIFIFCIGTNDCIKDTKTGDYWVSEHEYKANLHELINQAEEYSSNIVFLGNLGVDESKTHPYARDPDSETFNDDIEVYEKITAEVCVEHGLDFIDVYGQNKGEDITRYLSSDGLHENDEGHEYLANLVYESISNWL